MAAISFDKNLIEQNTSGASTMVGFDIDQMKTDTHLLLEQYHIFSKTPAAPTTALGGARNKAGHTTTSSDIWSQEIPAFFKAYSDDDLTRFATLAKKNDLVLLAYKKSETEPNGAVLKFVDGTWTKIHDSIASIPDGTEFYNSVDTKPVIRFHQNSAAVILSGDNNNTDGSNGFSAKICSWDESTNAPFPASALKFVPQFVSSMDKMINGIPSSGYDAIVKVGTTEDDILAESPSSPAGYIANNYAGIIHFNTARSDGQIYVHAFEYIGDKLDASLSGIRKDVQDIIGTTMEGVVASVGTNEDAQNAGIGVDSTTKTSPKITFSAGSVTTGETKLVTGDAVKTYVDTTALTPETGSIAKAIASAVEGAKVTINGSSSKNFTIKSSSVAKTENTEADIVSIVVDPVSTGENGESVIGIKATVNTATWDGEKFDDEDALLVAGVAQTVINNTIINQITEVVGEVGEGETPTIATAIKKGITDATLADADNAIASATGEAAEKLVTAEQVKEYVDENAKVTLTAATADGSTGITISPNATESTEFTIGIDQTVIATAASVTALSETVASDKKEVLGKIDTLSTTTITDSSVTGSGISVTLGGTVGAPTLAGSVTTASYTAATEDAAGSWTNTTYLAKASDVATAISDAVGAITIPSVTTSSAAQTVGVTASGHEVSVATATYTASTDTWTNKPYLVTGATVEAFVNDVVSEVSSDLTALENKVNAYHEAGVSYKVHTGTTLPDLSVVENVETYKNVILLVPTSTESGETDLDDTEAMSGGYIEYLCVKTGETTYAWEKIGTTEADLEGYVRAISESNGANHTSPVYASISSLGYLTLGIDSATSDKLGVSKMFTGDISPGGHTNVTDTAASLHSTAKMYGILAGSLNGKISNVTASFYLSLAGLDVNIDDTDDHARKISASVLSSNESLHSVVNSANPKTVEGGILTASNSSKRVIATDKIVNGSNMFASTIIETWVDDLSNMTNGTAMFKNCTELTTFIGDLSSLETADEMFYGCKLDAESLEILADTLPTASSLSAAISIGYGSLASESQAQAAKAAIEAKGWTCEIRYNA